MAYLNKHGEPVTLPNQEGELSTPSVVLFNEDEVIVGTEALRNAILEPERVVQNSKRFIGDPDHRWIINGKPYTPVDVATFVLKKMISAAQDQLGPIEQAVITVPAQFSDYHRQATVAAGHRAGLQRVDIINEPVAAALCYVLGSEGLWFTELADEQKILVYDLGGGTFDLSLVRYQQNEVSVIASSGDLNLGGIDWNHALEDAIAKQFKKEFGDDPTSDPSSKQFLSLEAEQTKRSLSVRPRAAMTCQHAGRRKTYQVEQERFEKLTASLVEHTADITRRMLKESQHGWGRIDVVLTTGGSSRMPMIRNCLKTMSGTTLNTSLSPDQSIAHGATYYAGMLLTNSKFARSILNEEATSRLSQIRQKSVTARGLGIMVRDVESSHRVPHYLIKPNTPLPTEVTEIFGTVMPNQRRVHLQIVESGLDAKQKPVKLGACVIDGLPAELPEGSEIAVTIRYDEQSLVHVDAKDVTSGKQASTQIIRHENLKPQLESPAGEEADVTTLKSDEDVARPAMRKRPAQIEPTAQKKIAARRKPAVRPAPAPRTSAPPKPKKRSTRVAARRSALEEADQPVALCNDCGEPLDNQGRCDKCGARATHAQVKPTTRRRKAAKPASDSRGRTGAQAKRRKATPSPRPVPPPRKTIAGHRPGVIPAPPNPDEIFELDDKQVRDGGQASQRSANRETQRPARSKKRQRPADQNSGEDEFWELSE
jgi:molecular chaperone DnaK